MSCLPHGLKTDPETPSDGRRIRVGLIPAESGEITDRVRDIFSQQRDIELFCCEDPAAAAECLSHIRPMVILACLGQPLQESLELIGKLSASPDSGNIPVIALASSPHAAARKAAYAAGASDCVVDLSDDLELLCRVRYCASAYQAHRDLESSNRELAQARSHLIQSEKMASMGILAAGVAHEINNPIAFVSSNLNSLEGYYRDVVSTLEKFAARRRETPSEPGKTGAITALHEALQLDNLQADVGEILEECRDGLLRVRKIVDNLKSFSRANDSEWQWIDLHEELDRALNLANNELKYKADVVKDYGNLPLVQCLATQINQVFLNLLVNAAHAIDGRGTITVATSQAASLPESVSHSAEDTDWVCISVTDDGVGVEPEKLSRIFDAFYTTKEVGKGTGLGLSVSCGIIQKHNGFIEVESEPGQGSTFSVWLPVSQDADSPDPAADLEGNKP